MKLTFSGAPEVRVAQAKVWSLLLDPTFVARSAPGVEAVETIDATHVKVVSAFGVGPLKLHFALDVEFFDIRPSSHARMRARGDAPGSTVDVISTIDLEALSPTRTRMTWTAESDIGGAIASIGGPLVEGAARKLTEQFWSDFARRVDAVPD